MNIDKFTIKTQEVLQSALEVARTRGHAEVGALHLLWAMIGQEQGAVVSVLQRIGVPLAQVAGDGDHKLSAIPTVSGGVVENASLGRDAHALLDAGWNIASSMGDEYLRTEHVLLAMLRNSKNGVIEILRSYGVESGSFFEALQEVRGDHRASVANW